tara:strand:+ start:762 stop:1040 length:279 start_codon:yes stop_codon:yes gene_type:complete
MFGLEGEVFGLFDNGILALCALFGIDIDKKLGGTGVHGGLYGGLLGNTLSDCVGALMDSSMRDEVIGITAGCFEVFVFVLIGMKIWDAVKTA